MRLYDNAPSSSYEELKTFYPVWYRDVLEMDALWRAFGNRLDDVQAGLVQAISNCYISTADEATIKRLEDFLYITYDGPRTLDERRALVSSFFVGNGHIGEQEIKETVRAFTAGEISVAFSGGVIEVSVTRELSDRLNLSDCLFILYKRIPAHLGMVFHDILLPIRFINKDKLVFQTFRVNGRFYNGGSSEPIFLDGRQKLDGSWRLDQMFRGILMPTFGVKAALSEKEQLTAPRMSFLLETAHNHLDYELNSLNFHVMFYNSGDTTPVLLDGRVPLDGSWELNQTFKGMELKRFSMLATFTTQNGATLLSSAFSLPPIANYTGGTFKAFRAYTAARNANLLSPLDLLFALETERHQFAAEMPSLAFLQPPIPNHTRSGLGSFRAATAATNGTRLGDVDTGFAFRAKQQLSISASVVMDSMYELDGSVRLDGSRKLNANIIKEDI